MRSWVALAAAYALVLQALFGAFAIGASASPAQFDAFGNVICTSHGAEILPDGSDPSKRSNLPDCCLVGCSMFASAALSVLGTAASLSVPPIRVFVAIIPNRIEHPVADREGAPGNPRAPPQIA